MYNAYTIRIYYSKKVHIGSLPQKNIHYNKVTCFFLSVKFKLLLYNRLTSYHSCLILHLLLIQTISLEQLCKL